MLKRLGSWASIKWVMWIGAVAEALMTYAGWRQDGGHRPWLTAFDIAGVAFFVGLGFNARRHQRRGEW